MRIQPDDPTYTPAEKALSWSRETRYGTNHIVNWGRAAAALGAEDSPYAHDPMTAEEAEALWKKHGNIKNKRWTMVMNHIGSGKDEVVKLYEKELRRYNSKLSMQGHYTAADWEKKHGAPAVICQFVGYEEDLTIYDPAVGTPNWWLDGVAKVQQIWTFQDKTGDMRLQKDLRIPELEDITTQWDVPNPSISACPGSEEPLLKVDLAAAAHIKREGTNTKVHATAVMTSEWPGCLLKLPIAWVKKVCWLQQLVAWFRNLFGI